MPAACLRGYETSFVIILCDGRCYMHESSKEDLLLNMGSEKDQHGVSEGFAKETFLFAKNGRSRTKEF